MNRTLVKTPDRISRAIKALLRPPICPEARRVSKNEVKSRLALPGATGRLDPLESIPSPEAKPRTRRACPPAALERSVRDHCTHPRDSRQQHARGVLPTASE